MRSLRTAARTVVLVTLTGVAPGCGYDNPGFKLKDSDPDSDSAAQTTNVSGVTMMTTTETSPTSTSTSTTSEPMTTQGPGVSGSETSTSTGVDPTTETPDTTTGKPQEPMPWDADCKGAEVTRTYTMLADTFFIFEDLGVGATDCDVGGPGAHVLADCNDVSFGGALSQQVFNHSSVDLEDESRFTRKVFVARFDGMEIVDDVSKKSVPNDAVIDISLGVFFNHIGGEDPTTFTLRRMETMIEWKAGSQAKGKCKMSEASWNCAACSGKEDETCADPGKPWEKKAPYSQQQTVLKTVIIEGATPDQPVSITISAKQDIFTEFPLLQMVHPGFVIIPAPNTPRDTMEIYTSDAGKTPTLTIRYCPDPNA